MSDEGSHNSYGDGGDDAGKRQLLEQRAEFDFQAASHILEQFGNFSLLLGSGTDGIIVNDSRPFSSSMTNY